MIPRIGLTFGDEFLNNWTSNTADLALNPISKVSTKGVRDILVSALSLLFLRGGFNIGVFNVSGVTLTPWIGHLRFNLNTLTV